MSTDRECAFCGNRKSTDQPAFNRRRDYRELNPLTEDVDILDYKKLIRGKQNEN